MNNYSHFRNEIVAYRRYKHMKFDDIVWSTASCSLKTFIDYYPLPQLVKVENGLYSEDEAKTLSAEQILTLHYTKKTDKVLAKTAERKPFYIPVTFPCKVEILPTFCKDRYYSVQDVVDDTSVKLIRVVHDSPPAFGLKAGDILELIKTVEEHREKYIICQFCDKTQDLVKLPLGFQAAFDPLAKAETYHLQEVLHSFELPVRVKFTSCDILIHDVNNEIDLLTLNSVLLKSLYEESTIIATSRWDNAVTVVMIPTDLDVTVHPAEGAINCDNTYARFCREIHDGADLEKVDLSLSNSLRVKEKPDVEVLYDYVEVKPPRPPRGSNISVQENYDDSLDDYEIPPPRPPKPPQLQTPPLSPTNTPSQQPRQENKGAYKSIPSDEDEHCPLPPVRTTSLLQSDERRENDKNGEDESDSDEDYLYPEEYEEQRELPQTLLKSPPPTFPKPKRQLLHQAKGHLRSAGDDNDDGDGYDDNAEDDGYIFDTYDSDFNDSGEDHDYIYPEYPTYTNTEITYTAQPNHDQGKGKWFSKLFKSKKSTPNPPATTGYSSSSTIYSTSGQDYSFPEDLSCLSVADLSECLRQLNLEKHVDTFSRSQIDGTFFLTLDKEMLSSLGVDNAFEQTKIMKFIRGWRPKT